ncbi:TRIC cation channel family protein [Mycobacterium sp. Y57]|uniref:TRIC cation channel family protein n=1 Tax=Mycolicibacterium xanthum TaxID=2796469 RepID=UPI001C8543DD|nr:TRIC cation channel family protein [Mycolicibacterium xanthum]
MVSGPRCSGYRARRRYRHVGFGLPAAWVILGIITAIGGGLLRDVLAGSDHVAVAARTVCGAGDAGVQ